MKSVLKITFAYLAAIIGAGFASGSELLIYFVQYGRLSFLGVVLTSIGFGIIIYHFLYLGHKYKIYSFSKLLCKFSSSGFAKAQDIFVCVFMAVMLGAMTSGFSQMVWDLWQINKFSSSLFFILLCYLPLVLSGDRIIKWGGYIGGFIVVFICLCCVYMINFRTVKVFSNTASVVSSSLIYTSYNAFAVCPVILSGAKSIKSKKQCIQAGVLSGVFSFAALFLIWCLLMVY